MSEALPGWGDRACGEIRLSCRETMGQVWGGMEVTPGLDVGSQEPQCLRSMLPWGLGGGFGEVWRKGGLAWGCMSVQGRG